ncbi:hypothetical protein [Rothia uropygialis]|nr:hypothetical protein [Kocuria sp. 36]
MEDEQFQEGSPPGSIEELAHTIVREIGIIPADQIDLPHQQSNSTY